ncbi:SsgA family sporulation/cell division regulator [Streptomyces sp. or3]|uniref:SsgA family sporulation/cell division regulator n=1 Tax=Streptomyces sp. or3 TaxID=1828020 RepID=UPI000BFE9651|nr:SsgA family sporulation/cell division regulator [Streptomyces sp. or3]
MSLHQDNAMPTAADDEFAALMAASSLRAPHVRALSDPIPDEAQSRLRETAEGPDADAEQEPTACETQEATADADAGDDSEGEPLASCRANNWQLPTLSRFLAEVYRHLPWIMDGDPGSPRHNALVLHGRPMPAVGPLETTRTIGILEWLRREPDHNRHYLVTHTGDALAPTLLPCSTDRSSTYSSSSALLRLALSRWRGEHLLDARPGADFPDYRLACTSIGPSADSLAWAGSAIRFHTTRDEYAALRLAGESERHALNSGSRLRLHALLNQTYESALAHYAARELGVNHRQFEQPARTPGTADSTGASAPAPALGTAGLTAGRLTDLLQPVQPPHLEPPRPHPSDGWTGCRISIMPDRIPAGAWRPFFLSALTDSWAPGTTAGQRLITGEAALNSLIPQDTTSVIDAPLTPAHLLIATDSAVSLDQAHRHTIPEQVPPPFDVDAYTAQPGSLLLLPDTTSAGHGDSREAANQTPGTGNPDKKLTSEDSSSDPSEFPNSDCRTPKLWSTKTDDRGDGLEQCVQLWMRQHHTEDDHGDRILTQLVYRTKDPYAVTAVFYAGTEEELEWTFARELLVDGLHTSIGLGDVIVWPGPEGPGATQRIFIRLRPPGNTALLSLDRDDVLEFLEATRPLPQNPGTKARTAVLASWEQELRDLICPSPGE